MLRLEASKQDKKRNRKDTWKSNGNKENVSSLMNNSKLQIEEVQQTA